MAPRCRDYLTEDVAQADIVIREEEYRTDEWPLEYFDTVCYMDSCVQFYHNLPAFNGMVLHASALEYDGKAYLFSGPSGVGKSTHAHLWQQLFGDAAQVFNDDKPALRFLDGQWYAYGTPWCGKDGINQNKKVPLQGICFLIQSKENNIRRLSKEEAIGYIMSQTVYSFSQAWQTEQMLKVLDKLVRNVPVFIMENVPTEEAARLSFQTMSAAEKE